MQPEREAPILPSPKGDRSKLVETARSLVGHRQVVLEGRRYSDDCAGLVQGVFAQVGFDLREEAQAGDNAVTAIYRFAANRGRLYEGGRPLPGDLVFFRETYDLNADGRENDGLTHVGVVEAVEADQTVLVIHRVHRGVVRYRMNLARKSDHVDPATGKTLNDYLRAAGARGKGLLTAELFSSYATLLPPQSLHATR